MTTIHFHYTDSYNNPSRGSLAFMPHRRHAANETEVLPKPFTIPLLNGEVTVNLQPNSSSWVWIITEYFEGVSKSFYTTVPDRDGVMEHTELVHISPSSIPAPYDAVEPAWWAEMRQYKTTVSDTLLKSGEALTEAQAAIETGRESVERTQHNASVAGAYADESRQSSYDARQYRDEAEQWRNEAQEQADRAATGPESAAARAEDAAERAETAETRARNYEDEARASAADARASETTATGAASTATERASDARNEANRAEAEANRAKTYADELMDGPREYVDQAREARDDAQGYATDAQTFADAAETSASNAAQAESQAATHHDAAQTASNVAAQHAAEANTYLQELLDSQVSGFAEFHGSSMEIPRSTLTEVLWDNHNIAGTALSRVSDSTVQVEVDGWYSISTGIRLNVASNPNAQIRIETADGTQTIVNAGRETQAVQTVINAIRLTQGDKIYVRVWQTSDETTDFSSSFRQHLSVAYLGTP